MSGIVLDASKLNLRLRTWRRNGAAGSFFSVDETVLRPPPGVNGARSTRLRVSEMDLPLITRCLQIGMLASCCTRRWHRARYEPDPRKERPAHTSRSRHGDRHLHDDLAVTALKVTNG